MFDLFRDTDADIDPAPVSSRTLRSIDTPRRNTVNERRDIETGLIGHDPDAARKAWIHGPIDKTDRPDWVGDIAGAQQYNQPHPERRRRSPRRVEPYQTQTNTDESDTTRLWVQHIDDDDQSESTESVDEQADPPPIVPFPRHTPKCWLCWHTTSSEMSGFSDSVDSSSKLSIIDTINGMYSQNFCNTNESDLCGLISEYHYAKVYLPAIENGTACMPLTPEDVKHHFEDCVLDPRLETARELRRINGWKKLIRNAGCKTNTVTGEEVADPQMVRAYHQMEQLRHLNLYQNFSKSPFLASSLPLSDQSLGSIVNMNRCMRTAKRRIETAAVRMRRFGGGLSNSIGLTE